MTSHLTTSESALWALILNSFDDSYASDSYLRLSRAQMLEAIWNAAAGSTVANRLIQSERTMLAGIVNEQAGSTIVSPLTHSWRQMLAAWFNAVSDDPDMSHLTSSSAQILAALVDVPVGANDPLTPSAPVLTWDTGPEDNTPTFTADFDDILVHAEGDIDGSNYDVIELNYDTDSGFGSPDSATNTLDAAELLAGEVAFTTGTLADGTWYARARHNHVVAGVDHWSAWSNTVSETIVTASGPDNAIELEGSTDVIELEGSTDYILLEGAP